MLARANRITKPEDFRRTLSSGVRVSGQSTTIHAVIEPDKQARNPAKIGFIVAKSCGSAVARNLIKRRLKSISRTLLGEFNPGTLVVVRALPASSTSDFQALSAELTSNFQLIRQKLERKTKDV